MQRALETCRIDIYVYIHIYIFFFRDCERVLRTLSRVTVRSVNSDLLARMRRTADDPAPRVNLNRNRLVRAIRFTWAEAILNCCQLGPRSDRLSELGAII